MSRESEQIAALRNRLAGAETPFELSRCHFEAHSLLRKFPGSVEGRLLLEQIERQLRAAQGTEAAPVAEPRPKSVWRSALRPLPWALALVVLTYVVLTVLRRYLR